MEMLMIGMPKNDRHRLPASHLRVIMKYIALPEMKKIPNKINMKYLAIL